MGGLQLTATVFQNGVASDPPLGVNLHIQETAVFSVT
jgi:hypothetical protein